MATGKRGLPPKSEGRGDFSAVQPDPSQVGGVAEAPFLRLPDPTTLFTDRAARFDELAADHPLGAYLGFLATIVRAQAACVAALPAPAPVPADSVSLRTGQGLPPIACDQIAGNADFAATLEWLLQTLDLTAAPEQARATLAGLRAMAPADRVLLAADIIEGSYAAELVAESLFLAAALQVHLARLAITIDATAITPPAGSTCPVCGGAPVASLVVGWSPANKARYCACGLCGTLWNYVRIKCTVCAETQGIKYFTLADSDAPASDAPDEPATIGVETCGACASYIKHMQQHADERMDPFADDIASFALDLLAREQSFRRGGINPLFLSF